jgi:DNA helicase HerA-like ATPase
MLPALANRHGLITGATGTGKTITLQTLAEIFRASACRCSWPTSRAT